MCQNILGTYIEVIYMNVHIDSDTMCLELNSFTSIATVVSYYFMTVLKWNHKNLMYLLE